MNNNSKCFIKTKDHEYEEITYEELEYRRANIPGYNKKKFIYVHKMLMEVSEEEYKDYYYEIERNRYSKKVLDKLCVISIDELTTQDKLDFIADTNIDIEQDFMKKVSKKELYKALSYLNKDEIKLINELFFNNYSLRKYANKIDVSYTTLYYKLKLILIKLKKLLEI